MSAALARLQRSTECIREDACYESFGAPLLTPERAPRVTMTAKGPPAQTTLRDGRYVLLRQLGAGSQGTTWEAVDKREGGLVAIKRFDVRGARSWKDVELAEREARVLAALSHPKLPRYVEHFEADGALYLVMEKVEGTPLSVLRKQGPADETQVLRLLEDADDVLTYLHGRVPVVIHRDLKPSNIIRRPDGSFAFVDFGAVRDRLRPEGGSTVVGTFGYMAPEQLQGRAGPGTDIYSLGATALAFLTGAEPETLPHRGLGIDVDAALGSRRGRFLREPLKAMLEPDPDWRATRIAPLLRRGAARDSGEGWPKGRHVDRAGERRERRAERRARRVEEREARRASSPFAHDREPWRAGWLPHLVVLLALTIAQLVVVVALRLLVPVALFVLSLFFGSGLQRAARAVSRAGGRASRAMGRARDGAAGATRSAARGGRARMEVADQAKSRVPLDEQALEDGWTSAEESARRTRGEGA